MVKPTAGQLGLAPKSCICDPMDLAAMGSHMLNCPAREEAMVERAKELVKTGKPIDAVKHVRAVRDCDLKEAYDFVKGLGD